MDEVRTKVENLVSECKKCHRKPQMWEETFFGTRLTQFSIKCPRCGSHTRNYELPANAIFAWNFNIVVKPRDKDPEFDDDAVIELMAYVMAEANKEYQELAGVEYPTKGDLVSMQQIEEFVWENPYMLPYDRKYVLSKMKTLAEEKRSEMEKARKKKQRQLAFESYLKD